MAHGHTPHEIHHVNYMAIFWWLLGLTILEIFAGVARAGPAYPHVLKGFLLVIMALGKAALVALYFMHLRFERRTLGFIALIPLMLSVFIVLMVLPDF